jgi:pyroglutamyl-peptidase
MSRLPKLLVTGFGPFPGAPANPTSALVSGLAGVPAEELGAAAFRAMVLPTDYRRSWGRLRRIYNSFAPDVVVHFGLSARAKAITVERFGRNACLADRPDAAGWWPRRALGNAEMIASTLPAEKIAAALTGAGISAELSDDAGGYVCNATLYRSLAAADGLGRLVAFVHVPPEGRRGISGRRLSDAAAIILSTASAAWTTGNERLR